MRHLHALIVAALGLALLSPTFGADAPPAGKSLLDQLDRTWADDPVWFDGKAEIATYEATRAIYGQPRHYTATIMTNKEHADPQTKTKLAGGAATSGGRAVFKHHVREDVPTEKYTYHFSTMVYVGVEDFKSLKIDMGSQEACGATFKQFVNHNGELAWHQFSYHPRQGHEAGQSDPPGDLVFHDALTLVLRGLPFDELKPGGQINFSMLPDQTSNKWSDTEPVTAGLGCTGIEELDLPYGKVKAHHVYAGQVYGEPYAAPMAARVNSRTGLWFAADPELGHVLVQYQGADGTVYRLKSLKREAYWVD